MGFEREVASVAEMGRGVLVIALDRLRCKEGKKERIFFCSAQPELGGCYVRAVLVTRERRFRQEFAWFIS
jgi:hypothetical protein